MSSVAAALFLLPAFVLGAHYRGPDDSAAVPQLIHEATDLERARPPVWVAADTALRRQGGVRKELFGQAELRRAQHALARQKKRGCFDIEKDRADFAAARRDALAADQNPEAAQQVDAYELFRGAYWVLAGTVVDSDFGFYLGRPRQLVEIDVEATVHHRPEFDKQYLSVPAGQGTAGGEQFCLEGSGISETPAVGDRIILVHHAEFYGGTAFMQHDWPITEAARQNFLLIRSGQIISSIPLQQSDGPELEAALSEAVERHGFLAAEDDGGQP